MAAAKATGGADAIISLLRRQRGRTITEEALAALAQKSPPEVVELALDLASDTAVTARVALAVVRNRSYSVEIFSMLLDRAGRQFEITEMLLDEVSSDGWDVNGEMLSLLVRRGGEGLPITTEFIKGVAKHCDSETMELLLDRKKPVWIPKSVAVAAAANEDYGAEVMRVLLAHDGRDFDITSALIETASSNTKNLPDLMATLLNEPLASEVVITPHTIKCSARDMDKAAAIMGMFARCESSRFRFGDEAVQLAMQSFNADAVALLLAHQRRFSQEISEWAVHAAAAWSGQNGKEVVCLLLDQLGEEFPVTDLIVNDIAENLDDEVMKRLLDLHGASIYSRPELICGIAKNKHHALEVLEVLLQFKGADFTINDDAVEASVKNASNGKVLTSRLLSLDTAKFAITANAVAAVSRYLDAQVLRLILDRWGEASKQLPEKVLKSAVQNEPHGIDVVNLLLDQYGLDIPLTANVASAAAGNEVSGFGIMSLLLGHNNSLPLSLGTVNVAAANTSCGYALMSLFLDHDQNILLTENTLIKIAENGEAASAIFDLLFQRRLYDFPVGTEVLKAVACNEEHGLEIMEALLEKRGCDIHITPDILECAAKNEKKGPAMTKLLLNRAGRGPLLTEEVLIAAASRRDHAEELTALLRVLPRDLPFTESMVATKILHDWWGAEQTKRLFDYRGASIPITKGLIETILDGCCSKEVVRVILRWQAEDFPVSDEIVTSIVKSYDSNLVACFLDLRGESIHLTPGHLQAAATNRHYGPEVLEVLLDHSGDIPITEEVVIAAAGQSDTGARLMELLIKRYGQKVPITEKVIAAIATSGRTGEESVALLLKNADWDVTLTEELVGELFRHRGTHTHRVLLALCRGVARITEQATAALVEEFQPDEVAALLDQCGERVPITTTVIQAALRNWEHRDKIAHVLLTHRPNSVLGDEIWPSILTTCSLGVFDQLLNQQTMVATLTAETVLAVAEEGSDSVVQSLLNRPSQDIPISAQVVEAIAGGLSGETMSLLLARRGEEMNVTEKVIDAAVKENVSNGQDVVSVLLNERPDELHIDEAIIVDMVERFDAGFIDRLYAHLGSNAPLTSSVLRAAAANKPHGEQILKSLISKHAPLDLQVLVDLAEEMDPQMMRVIIQEQGDKIPITKDLVTGIIRNYKHRQELMVLLLQLQDPNVPVPESTLIDIFGQFDVTMIGTLLDKHGDDIQLTEQVIMAALDGQEAPDVMKLLLERRAEDIPLTEPLLMAMVDKLDARAMALLLDKRPGDLTITEALVEAAMGNYNYRNELLPLFLSRCDEDMQISEAAFSQCARTCNGDFIKHLLKRLRTDITVTEGLVMLRS
ncbi:hypothetical protein BDW69DRAFT_190254 [Aspergillus filifer]